MTAGQAPKGRPAIANPAAWPARPPAKLPTAGLQLQFRRACKSQVGPLVFHWLCYSILLVVAIIFVYFSVGWLRCQLHLSLVSRFQCLLFILACRGFAYCFDLVCNGLACCSIVLSMVPAGFHGLAPWLASFFLCWSMLLDCRPFSCLGPLVFIAFAIALVVLAILFACFLSVWLWCWLHFSL